jgi:hypothetical protein
MAAIHPIGTRPAKAVRWILGIILVVVFGVMTFLLVAPHLCAHAPGCDL